MNTASACRKVLIIIATWNSCRTHSTLTLTDGHHNNYANNHKTRMNQVLMSKGTKTISGTSRRWISNANGTNQLSFWNLGLLCQPPTADVGHTWHTRGDSWSCGVLLCAKFQSLVSVSGVSVNSLRLTAKFHLNLYVLSFLWGKNHRNTTTLTQF